VLAFYDSALADLEWQRIDQGTGGPDIVMLGADGKVTALDVKNVAQPSNTEAFVVRSPEAPYNTGRERTVSETEWALLQDFALLPDDEKQTLRMRLAEKARDVRRKADEMFFGKHNIPHR
jgi:hypothetical protein